MKNQITIGWILVIAALLVIVGMIAKNDMLWSFIDTAVILVCGGTGIYLIRQNIQK
jgi:uncharacterized protein (UPF0333 family)